MGILFRKLTPAQQYEVQAFKKRLNSICRPCQTEFVKCLVGDVSSLYARLAAPNYSGKPIGIDDLVELARQELQALRDHLAQARSQLILIKPPSWYPKMIHQAYDSWTACFDWRLGYIEMVVEALEPPEPLARQPGRDKVAMFITGWNIIRSLPPGLFISED